MHEHLSNLARETSGDKRRELMRTVADIFTAQSEDFSDRELYLFGEVFIALLSKVDSKCREELSHAIATIKEAPRDLALVLAYDEISVARPILELSPVLTDDNLVKIASSCTTDHRLAISKRNNLSTSVTDALIIHGEQPVMCSVISNETAKISDEGFDNLIRQAENNQELCKRLSHRTDMPVQMLKRIIPLVPASARKRLVALIDSHGDSIVDDLVEEASQLAQKAVLDNRTERLEARILLKDINAGQRQIDTVIENLCAEDRPMDVSMIIAKIAAFPEKYVASSLMNMNGEAIAVLCRTLGLSDKAFAAIAAMRCKRFQLPSSMANRLTEQYAAIDPETAQRTLRFSKVRNRVAG